MKRKLKQIPTFTSDEAIEEFLEKTDLSEYDFSAFKPLRIEIETKPKLVNKKVPTAKTKRKRKP